MTSQRHIPRVAQERPTDPVLAAAQACILEVGLRRTTLADVARRAGVSRMTVYRQWGDLDAIVSALLTQELLGAMWQAAAASRQLPTGRARLVAAAVATVAAIAANPLYRRILELDPELLLPLIVDRLGSTQRAAVEQVSDQLRAGRRDGSVRRGAPIRPTAVLVVVTLSSYLFSVRVLEAEHAAKLLTVELRLLLDGWLAPGPAS